jgi:hypothetical protein
MYRRQWETAQNYIMRAQVFPSTCDLESEAMQNAYFCDARDW